MFFETHGREMISDQTSGGQCVILIYPFVTPLPSRAEEVP